MTFQGSSDEAQHLAGTNFVKDYQSLVNAYSVAFFDHYLKATTRPDPLAPLTGNPPPNGVSLLKVAGTLFPRGVTAPVSCCDRCQVKTPHTAGEGRVFKNV
jgi:hypothetical protein